MGDHSADRPLVERVQRGDKKAFDLLVLKYQTKIVKLVSRYVREQSEALDLAQEVFLKAYRSLASFRGDSAFYTWLYRIAINTCKNHLAAVSRRRAELAPAAAEEEDEAPALEDLQEDSDTPERLLLTEEIRNTVYQAIEQLPVDLRTAIVLREMEGLSYEEIAAAMGCPIGTVRSRIFRARESIDKHLRPLLE